MKASELLDIANIWRSVFDNLKGQQSIEQEQLKKLSLINDKFISLLRAEKFLRPEYELENSPTVYQRVEPDVLYFHHIQNVLNRRKAIEPGANHAYNKRHAFRMILCAALLMLEICRDLFLLLTGKATLAALLTLAHLSWLVLPLIAIGLWLLYDKYYYFHHASNLEHVPLSLQNEMLEIIPRAGGLNFFEKPENQAFRVSVNEQYKLVNSF